MNGSLTLNILLILLFCTSCFEQKNRKVDINERAKYLYENISQEELKQFDLWTYAIRGENCEIWTKQNSENNTYTCIYTNKTSEKSIFTLSISNLIKDYPLFIELPKVKDIGYTLTKKADTTFQLLYRDTSGIMHIYSSNKKSNKLFKDKDLFEHLSYLSNLKEKFGLVRTSNNRNRGNFIEFFISYEDVLTYIPNDLQLNPKYKDIWLNTFKEGNQLNKNWNLRKLEQPIDNG